MGSEHNKLAWWNDYKLVWVGALFGLGFYVLDAVIDYLVFHGEDLYSQLVSPGPVEIWIRTSVFVICVLYGLYANNLLQRSRSTERFLGAVVENIPDMVFIKSADDLRFVRLNRAGEDLLGYASADLAGKSDYDFFPREQADAFTAADREVIASGVIRNVDEEEIDTLYRGRRVLHTRKVPVFNARGDAQYLLGISEDITERKHAEDALVLEKARAEHYLQISEAMIIGLDETGSISLINRRGCEVLGYEEHEILGKNWFQTVIPEDCRVEVYGVFQRIMDGELEVDAHYENEVLCSSGEHRHIAWNNSVLTDGGGAITGTLSSGQDITQRKQSEDQLRLAATVFESSSQGVIITDRDNRIISVNPAFSELTGFTLDDVRGKSPGILQAESGSQEFYRQLLQSIARHGYWKGEIWGRRKDGEKLPTWQTISAVSDENGDLTHYVSVFTDISILKQQQQTLDFLAHHDPMTGLPNRLTFDDRLEHALQRHLRSGNMLALLFLDLDGFTRVNDTYGHAAGDHLLKDLSRRLQSVLREEDTIARFGGDEFAILVESSASPEAIEQICRKIIAELSQPSAIDGHDVSVAVSIGIALAPNDGEDARALLRCADNAMYRAKESGGNRYRFH